MTTETSAGLSGVTVLLVQMVKWGYPQIQGGWAVTAVAIISFVFCALWALGGGMPLTPESLYPFASGWVSVMATAAGVYGFVSRPIRAQESDQ